MVWSHRSGNCLLEGWRFPSFLQWGFLEGDQKKYLSAILTLSDEAVRIGENLGVGADSPEELAISRLFNRYVQGEMEKVNRKIARVQTIKRFSILPHSFSEETGELTPTMKVKRNIVIKKYEKEIDTMY